MSLPLVAALTVLAAASTTSAAVRYDQTQTGSTNVHLQIKNVEVMALLDDMAGGEYDYDYSDFTVKPLKPGGSSNSTASTVSSTLSTPTNSSLEDTNTTAASSETLLSSTSAPLVAEESEVEAVTVPAKGRRCGTGYYRDTLGRCRRIRRPHLQMMVNLARTKTTGSPLAT